MEEKLNHVMIQTKSYTELEQSNSEERNQTYLGHTLNFVTSWKKPIM